MMFLEELQGQAIIANLSAQKGVPQAEIEAAIQEAIDQAWTSPDPISRDLQRKIFRGKKPSPALFIAQLAKHIKNTPGF